MDQIKTETIPTKYLIVGAGPMGLVVARAFLRADIEFEMVERHRDVGGIWDIENPGSPMYETCHFITSKKLGGFVDYPMPEDYPTYPSWRLVLQYIRQMAKDYGIYPHIRFNLSVKLAEPIKVSGVDAWKVTTDDGDTRVYRGVVYASGQQWKQYIPKFSNMDKFQGELLAGNQYKSPKQFEGKRVLIVGAGNSGVDIAADAAEYAEKAFLSTRRAYHFLPKQVFGIPTPDLLDGRIPPPPIPGINGKLSQQQLAELALAVVGDLSHYGLPVPTEPLGSTQAIVNDTILHCFTHGTLKHVPNIKTFHENKVEFDNDQIEEIDLVLFCTGYDIEIPWLPEGIVDYDQGHPVFHIGAIAPKVRNFYGVGVIHPSRADAWTVFDQLSQIIVADALATLTGKSKEAMEIVRNEFNPDLHGDFPFLDVRRNANQVNIQLLNDMIDELETRFGIAMPSQNKPGFYLDPRKEKQRAAS
ncbi:MULTISPECIES: flavin-containing monooxygenase [unclassified Acinetobacter]|uniref:flavin-containing monooxygenase n=1 Tax=unclassified Acinetobacter TaxID=196816 RepID=UPI002934B17B|nr:MULTISPECIES: NAD(P)-binding domain-containing protein [unclassified Acinetobacter]WOE32517.1 NAD(P)-binding domain-containing protein [Acinetobacter sp. SAAs470]WOE37993.1 NAD(P)-binding domain-containing protein [Acinetobacter sp. SAAs474]